MSASSMLITDAGIAEVINAEKNGTAPVVLTHVGLGTGQYEPTSDLTALKAEFKRLSTISGGAVGDNRIHVSVNDASNDAYTVYEVGIFTASGTLFAVAARKIPIIQKAAVSEAYLSIDFDVNNLDPDSVEWRDVRKTGHRGIGDGCRDDCGTRWFACCDACGVECPNSNDGTRRPRAHRLYGPGGKRRDD